MKRRPFLLFFLLGSILASVGLAQDQGQDKNGQIYYSDADARRLFHLAASAYGDRQQECVDRAYSSSDSRRVLSVHSEECDALGHACTAFIVHSDAASEAVVVFRGTKTLTQLFTEGWQSLTPNVDFFGLGNVNRYFMTAHLSLWPHIERYLADPRYQYYNVVFTGHSLGGALASLAAARAVRQGFRRSYQVRALTFGQPRVGGARFAFAYDSLVPNSFRVINAKDIVPHLPACAKISSLTRRNVAPCNPNQPEEPYHHGTEVWYPEGMTTSASARYVVCRGSPQNEDFECSARISFYIDDVAQAVREHRSYFGLKVSEHGKNGCVVRNETSTLHRALSRFNSFVKGLGFE